MQEQVFVIPKPYSKFEGLLELYITLGQGNMDDDLDAVQREYDTQHAKLSEQDKRKFAHLLRIYHKKPSE